MSDTFAGAARTISRHVALTLNETATIARTGKTVKCRVEAFREGGARLPLYLPSYVTTARWHLVFALGTDVRDGDTVVTLTKGTFFLIENPNDGTYESQLPLAAIKTRRPDGTLNLVTNQSVTFIAGDERYQLTKDVYLYPASLDVSVMPSAIQFQYGIVWDSDFTYLDVTTNLPTTRHIRREDKVTWTDSNNSSHIGLLGEPNNPLNLVPFSTTHFNELLG